MLPWLDIPRRALDPDAKAFAALSGATDVRALSTFVKGVKALGLWNSMVCWPLRSSQNAGSGTTAYSLGGLGTYNGTLVNGPTWGASGVVFSGITEGITMTGLPTSLATISMGVRVNPGTVTSNRDFLQLNGVKLGVPTAPSIAVSCSGVGNLSPQTGTISNSTIVSISASISPSGGNSTYSADHYKDGVLINSPTRALSNPTSYFSIGNGDNLTRSHAGTYSFAWMVSGTMSGATHGALNALIAALTQ